MNCPRCNTPLAADARFCGMCGVSVPLQAENALSQVAPENNDATIMASWSEVQSAQGLQAPIEVPQPAPSAWYGGTPQGQPGTVQGQSGVFQTQPGVPWPQQPETFQAQAGFWPQQPTQAWTEPQLGMNSQADGVGVAMRPKRRRRIWLRMLLVMTILLAVLAGSWFLGVRPYVHGLAESQLDQALTGAGNQITLFQVALPTGSQTLHVPESDVNNYLQGQETDQLKNLHMTIMPNGLQLDFQAYGFNCTILALPIVSGGALQVTNVQVQGILWLIMSNDELTTILNTHLKDIGQHLTRAIQTITLKAHQMDVQIN